MLECLELELVLVWIGFVVLYWVLELELMLECFGFDGFWVLELELMLAWIGFVGYWVLAFFDKKEIH